MANAQTLIPMSEAAAAIFAISPFIGRAQMQALWDGCRHSEEKAFFRQRVVDLAATIKTMPKTYDQDGLGMRAVAHLHYFTSAFDFFITEKDRSGGTKQAFGLACAHEREIGYINIREIVEAGAELDLYWAPKALGEIGR